MFKHRSNLRKTINADKVIDTIAQLMVDGENSGAISIARLQTAFMDMVRSDNMEGALFNLRIVARKREIQRQLIDGRKGETK